MKKNWKIQATNMQQLEQPYEEDFTTSANLSPKKYKEAMMGSDRDIWIELVNKEHGQRVQEIVSMSYMQSILFL